MDLIYGKFSASEKRVRMWRENNTGRNEGLVLFVQLSLHGKKKRMWIYKPVRHVCVCGEKAVSISLAIIQSNARLFLLALKKTRAGWKYVSLLRPRAYSSGETARSLIPELCVCVCHRVGAQTSQHWWKPHSATFFFFFFSKYTFAVKIIYLFIPWSYLLGFFKIF